MFGKVDWLLPAAVLLLPQKFPLLEALWNVDAPPCQFREQTHAARGYKSKGLLDSRGLSTSWLLALDACGITATLHNGVSSVRMLPNGFLSFGEAGQGRKVS